MTNEQTAILLRSIAQRIRCTAGDIEDMISDGQRESERIWVGEGPCPPQPIVPDLSTMFVSKENKHAYYRNRNWEYKQVGKLLAVVEVESIALWLDEQVETLLQNSGAA